MNKVRSELSEIMKELLSPGNYITKAKNACRALTICSSEEGAYRKEMQVIVSAVNESIFQEKEKISQDILSEIYEKHTEAILDNNYIPYFYIAESALEILESAKKEITALKNQISLKKNGKCYIDLKTELKQKLIEIRNLKSYIDINISEPLKIKDNHIKSLEDKLMNSGKMIAKLNDTIFENEEIIKQMKNQAGFHKRRIIELQNLDEEKELKIGQLNRSIDELKVDFKLLQEQNYKYKYYLETSIIRLKQANEREKNLELRNNEIESKNLYLGVRAAEGFENLTPRPSFIGIEEILPEIPKSTKEKARKIISLALFKTKSESDPNRKRPGMLITTKKNNLKGSDISQNSSPVISPMISSQEKVISNIEDY